MITPIASTQVWHNGKAYDVSTIDRECSAVGAHGMLYAETIVWDVGPDGKRGRIVCQDEAAQGSIVVHQNIVATLRDYGPKGLDTHIRGTTMSCKHTPGPWHARRLRDNDGTPYATQYHAHIDIGVCMVWAPPGNEEQEANASLIAAAPHLLEALKMMVRLADEGKRPLAARKKARAAIGLALGHNAGNQR